MRFLRSWAVMMLGMLLSLRFGLPAAENVMSPSRSDALPGFGIAERLDYVKLLPPPPARDSMAELAELEVVKQVQAWRTEEQVAWAKMIDRDVIFNHSAVVGAWFSADRLPKTAEFFKRLDADIRAVDRAAKLPFLRARPTTVDPDLKPCLPLPKSTGYPSGSAMQSHLWAELLSEALPAQAAALKERGHRAAWARVIGGVHFPSDIQAGKELADVMLRELRQDSAFRDAWSAARAEIAAAVPPAQ